MSWRATPSTPAPPLTSTTSNSLFGPPSTASSSASSSRYRSTGPSSSSSNAGSALSHLARQKAEMEAGADDDKMSMRSYRSTKTLRGGDSGSVRRPTRERGASTSSRVSGSGGSDGRNGMNVDGVSRPVSPTSTISTSANLSASNARPPLPNAFLDRPASIDGGTVPQVVKRARVEPRVQQEPNSSQTAESHQLTRTKSWFGSGSWRTLIAPYPEEEVATAAAIELPKAEAHELEASPPASSTSSLNTKLLVPPLPPIIPRNGKGPTFEPAPSTSSSSSLKSSLNPRVRTISNPQRPTPSAPRIRTISTVSKKSRWFSSSYVEEEEVPPVPPLRKLSPIADASPKRNEDLNASAFSQTSESSNTSSTASRHLEVPGVPSVEGSKEGQRKETEAEAVRRCALEREEEVRRVNSTSRMTSEGSGSWMDLISKSIYGRPMSDLGRSEATPSIDREISREGSITPKARVMESEGGGEVEDSNGTIKVASAPLDNATLTPTPRVRQIPSVANQRQSWWGWSVPLEDSDFPETATSAPNDEPQLSTISSSIESMAPPPLILSPRPTHPSPPASSISSISSITGTILPRTWLQTIWGEPQAEVKLISKKEEARPAVNDSAARNVKPLVAEAGSKPPLPATSAPEITKVSIQTPISPIINPQLRDLKHKSSWSFFPSRGTSLKDEERALTVPSSPLPLDTSSSIPVATGLASDRGRATTSKPLSLLGKSPLNARGLNVASSASSRTSSRGDPSSAPNSPRLGPQSDGPPLKPLTGSMKSSPRPATYEPNPPIENLVLPTFTDTFLRPPRSFAMKKSKLNKAVDLFSAYLFSQPPGSELEERRGEEMRKGDPAERLPKSFERMPEGVKGKVVGKVKRVVTIGVHGWFPNPMLKSVFGEPTGTSVKFSTMMHDAVHSYLESHDFTSFNIQAIALEGEGQVSDRVNKLYSQLLSRAEWVEALRMADVVFLATHSQGSVVSTHLVSRMLREGLVKGSNIHLLAMCAIAQGPFVYLSQSYALQPYFTYLESAAARELFEFQDPESEVAKKFLKSLSNILAQGVKVTCVGSINDQVVPLYSALFAGISHPSLLRAVYIDSAAFRTSDFLANLVVFATRLRNAGLIDHDLIYHISEALAGALTGVGHSKIYEEEDVFNLAVKYHFETTLLEDAPTCLPVNLTTPAAPLTMSFNPRDRRNPYLLTWALRGIVEDPQVRELFGPELTALREAYETWKPVTKTLREVKLKLEGIRSLSFQRGKM